MSFRNVPTKQTHKVDRVGTVAVVLVFFWGFVMVFFGLGFCVVAGVKCVVGGLLLLLLFFPEGSNHALKFYLQSFLVGGNIPCTEDYCRGTVSFVPEVYLQCTCTVVPGFLLACAQMLPISHFI